MGCEEGDWRVHDEQSMRAALEAAGQSVAALCSGGYISSSWDGEPSVYEPNGNCWYRAGLCI